MQEMKDREEGNQQFFQRPLCSPPTRAPRKIRQKRWTAAKTQSAKGGTYTRMKGTKRRRQTEAWGGEKGHTAPDGSTKLQEQEQTLKKTKKVPRAIPKNTDYSLRRKISMQAGEKAQGSMVGLKVLPKGATEPSPGLWAQKEAILGPENTWEW